MSDNCLTSGQNLNVLLNQQKRGSILRAQHQGEGQGYTRWGRIHLLSGHLLISEFCPIEKTTILKMKKNIWDWLIPLVCFQCDRDCFRKKFLQKKLLLWKLKYFKKLKWYKELWRKLKTHNVTKYTKSSYFTKHISINNNEINTYSMIAPFYNWLQTQKKIYSISIPLQGLSWIYVLICLTLVRIKIIMLRFFAEKIVRPVWREEVEVLEIRGKSQFSTT